VNEHIALLHQLSRWQESRLAARSGLGLPAPPAGSADRTRLAGALPTGHRAWLLALVAGLVVSQLAGAEPPVQSTFKAVLLGSSQASPACLKDLRSDGFPAVVLSLAAASASQDAEAARRIQGLGFDLYYWIEVGRCPELADRHPEWMASLQGHPEWRRFFPSLPAVQPGEVVKNYPWVPVLYEEAFAAHVERVKALLAQQPVPKGIFLNDLQGAPSACGCGHPLCRWTTDYGPIKTATRLPNQAAARFVQAVKALAPGVTIVPVWTPECEAHDKEGLCAGVDCYQGTCWKEFTAQLTPVAEVCERIAALLPYRAFQRDLPRYGPTAGWVTQAVKSFGETPQQAKPLPAHRLLTVLQGWEVGREQIQAQILRSAESGAAGYLLSLLKIEQDWEPRIVKLK